MTNAEGAVRNGCGGILASFREIPVVCLDQVQRLATHLNDRGIRGVPVGIDKAGIVVIGGLNPIAVLEENGIETEDTAMSTLVEYSRLAPFLSVLSQVKAAS